MKSGLYIGRVTFDGNGIVAGHTRIALTDGSWFASTPPDVPPGAFVRVCTLAHHAGPRHSFYLLQPADVLELDEIANILNVGISYTAQLLIDRRIPSQPFARCLFSDVMAYKDSIHAQRSEAMAEMVRLSEEAGYETAPSKEEEEK